MTILNRRIRDVEDNHILEWPKRGTTQFCTYGLPEPEQILLEKARKLAVMEISFEDLTEEQEKILSSADKLLRFHIFDLFTGYMEGLMCRGDKIAIMTLHERFLWFITELRKEMQQQREVSEIEKTVADKDEVDKVDEYFRKAPPLFTQDSYDKVIDDVFRGVLESEKGKKMLENWKKKTEGLIKNE